MDREWSTHHARRGCKCRHNDDDHRVRESTSRLRGARTFMIKIKTRRGEPLNEKTDTQAENARQLSSECQQWTTRTAPPPAPPPPTPPSIVPPVRRVDGQTFAQSRLDAISAADPRSASSDGEEDDERDDAAQVSTIFTSSDAQCDCRPFVGQPEGGGNRFSAARTPLDTATHRTIRSWQMPSVTTLSLRYSG